MINKRKFFFSLCSAFILLFLLTYITLKKYNWNFSALLYIWKGFYLLNPTYFPRDFVIFTQGGYDGQFFYLIARYLYSFREQLPPILDSFELRFSRIGLSFFSGLFSFFLGWKVYPIVTFIILWSFHFFSSFLLYQMLSQSKQQYIFLLYLFSPFSWSSNFLLVSDSLFSSFLILILFFLKRFNFHLQKEETIQIQNNILVYVLSFFTILFFLLIRETGTVFIVSFLLLSIYKKSRGVGLLFLSSLFVYSMFVVYVKFFHFHLLGTNPMSFFELVDFPFFGFWKSIANQEWTNPKSILKIFILISLLILTLLHFQFAIFEGMPFLTYLPLIFYSALILVAEEGYYNNYDNISRFFTPILPYVILTTKEMNPTRKLYFGIVFLLFFMFLIKSFFRSAQDFFII